MTAIRTESLGKIYPASGSRLDMGSAFGRRGAGGKSDEPVVALQDLDLSVPRGEFFGLLGPNGAGKTTTLGILTTRIRPTSGRALVAGADVSREAVRVRQRIGVVPQRPNPDRALTALENLVFHASYFGYRMSRATGRARELLERLHLSDKADSRVEAMSGGQQQRLMIARALIHEPEILFLDEPTVGLDPNARRDLWDVLRDLHDHGRTIVMTTHYMEEADRLCQRVAIVDQGRLLALDTPAALKAREPGGTLIEVTLDGDAGESAAGAAVLDGVEQAAARGSVMHVYSRRGGAMVPPLIRIAESRGRSVVNIRLTQPSLESLFVSMTGRKLE
ncbi:MAG: ABC transporter ATP-binding protein [Planctomycetota bacterium]